MNRKKKVDINQQLTNNMYLPEFFFYRILFIGFGHIESGRSNSVFPVR